MCGQLFLCVGSQLHVWVVVGVGGVVVAWEVVVLWFSWDDGGMEVLTEEQ